jgi:hypothetical protein
MHILVHFHKMIGNHSYGNDEGVQFISQHNVECCIKLCEHNINPQVITMQKYLKGQIT